jgi:hypothetical protein
VGVWLFFGMFLRWNKPRFVTSRSAWFHFKSLSSLNQLNQIHTTALIASHTCFRRTAHPAHLAFVPAHLAYHLAFVPAPRYLCICSCSDTFAFVEITVAFVPHIALNMRLLLKITCNVSTFALNSVCGA